MRLTFIKLLLAAAGLTFLATEVLSYFNILTPSFIRLFWGAVLGVAGYWAWSNRHRHLSWGGELASLSRNYLILCLVAPVLMGAVLLFLAVYSPPNNVDSINYHLTRVVCWLQNHNVKHYPTFHVQQLYHNVMSEYLLLHVLAISGHDYLVNAVQWGAMLGTVAGVGLIAKQLGLSLKVQLLVSILQLTLPIGILESTSTQNDYVATFFFVSFMYFGLRLIQKFSTPDVWWMSASLALGGFTKYPVFFYALPYCIWIGIHLLRKAEFKRAFYTFGVAAGLLVLVFGPFFSRNYALFGSILSPKSDSPLFVENIAAEEYCFTCTLSNTAKNLGLHLGLPSAGYNAKADALMGKFHHLIGMDINNPRLSLDNYRTQFVIQEDMSGNLLLLTAIVISTVWLLFQKKSSLFKGVLVCAWIGFLIFCTAAKFQLWSSRTHMPFFAQGTVLVGVLLSVFPDKWKLTVGYFFILTAVPYIVDNFNKPLLPIRYASKYLLGYVPRHVCVPVDADEQRYQAVLETYYNFSKPEPCFPLHRNLSYKERQQLVTKLNELGYYELESEHLFKYPRERYFFICDNDYPNTYHDFKALTKYISSHSKGVGMMLDKRLGFYPYWSMLHRQMPDQWQMKYILFQKEYLALPNAHRIFAYDYILCDNEKLISHYVPSVQIETIYRTPTMVLVKLKKSSVQTYPY
ncbi:MAG: hypothetical protein U0X91_24635 [Spirosomataceae bacterium]